MRRNINLKTLTIAALILPTNIALADCAPDRVQFKMGNGRAAFTVEVVDTDKTRAKGLMFRKTMPKFSGMLFLFDHPQRIGFWMRNTLIPLDMIFFDQTGTVAKVHPNAVPLDETVILGGNAILAVLEINAGLAQTLRIKPGAVMQHPAFDQQIAAWPCKN